MPNGIEADLIRRRQETASTRSQANTARLLADHPILVRFKELELIRQTLAGARATFILGSTDLASQVRGLMGESSQGEAGLQA